MKKFVLLLVFVFFATWGFFELEEGGAETFSSTTTEVNEVEREPAKNSSFFWGVNGHLPSASMTDPVPTLDRAVEMHFSIVRLDMRWDIVEPEPLKDVMSSGHWSVLDASVDQVFRRGMRPLALITGKPAWASSNGLESGTLTEIGKVHYAEFVKAMLHRYKGKVELYEVANEPNLIEFWVGTVDQYVDQILIPTREIIKSVDPQAKVLGPALSNLMNANIKVQKFYSQLGKRQKQYSEKNKGQKFFDILTHHTYNTTPEGVIAEFTKGRKFCIKGFCLWTLRKPLLKIFSENGFTTEPIWLNEFGWDTNPNDVASEEKQGKYLVETLKGLAQLPRLEAGFVYQLFDDPRRPIDSGVLDSKGQPKRAYYHLKEASP